MKKFLIIFLIFIGFTSHAQVKIGNSPTNVSTSSSLELESTNKALVVTRVADTTAITTPINGMIIYCNADNKFKVYQNNTWVNMFD